MSPENKSPEEVPQVVTNAAEQIQVLPVASITQDVEGLRYKDLSGTSIEGALILTAQSLQAQGLEEGEFARHGNNIVFIKNGRAQYGIEKGGVLEASLKASGLTKSFASVGIPPLGDPNLYWAGQNDSTFKDIQGKASY
jgi:hypothetical protein